MKSYKDLIVWQKSMELAEEIYFISRQLPRHEMFGFSSQIQRAAVAIPSNIAEGYKRNHRREYIQFLAIANGSAAELETQLLLMEKIYGETISLNKAKNLVEEILKMLYSMIDSLKRSYTTAP